MGWTIQAQRGGLEMKAAGQSLVLHGWEMLQGTRLQVLAALLSFQPCPRERLGQSGRGGGFSALGQKERRS